MTGVGKSALGAEESENFRANALGNSADPMPSRKSSSKKFKNTNVNINSNLFIFMRKNGSVNNSSIAFANRIGEKHVKD
jgi:hypothetical protein